MGKLRTSEDLEQLFKENREKRERQLQKERERKTKLRQEEYKRLSKLADKLLQDEKNKKMEELQALAKKCSQKALNEATEPSETVRPYRCNRYVERATNDRDIYMTREELQQWERDHWKCINWDKWDELVAKGREELKNIPSTPTEPTEKPKHNYKKIAVYVYDGKLDLIGEYSSVYKASKAFGVGSGVIRHLIETNKPHKKLGITVLLHKLQYDYET